MSHRRSPEEIRASIEINRQELVASVNSARMEVARLTDWRAYVVEHKREIAIAAAATGFLIGSRIVLGRRRR